jgi:hypothetical protein
VEVAVPENADRIASAILLIRTATESLSDVWTQEILAGRPDLQRELVLSYGQLGTAIPTSAVFLATIAQLKGDTVPEPRSIDQQYLADQLLHIQDVLLRIARAVARNPRDREMQNAIVQAGRTFLTAVQEYLPKEDTNG